MAIQQLPILGMALVAGTLLLISRGCGVSPPTRSGQNTPSSPPTESASPAEEKGVATLEPINKTDEEWRKELTPEQYRVLRQAGTEPPGSGTFLKWKKDGTFTCAGCGLVLFKSETKYDSGCGWPSFYQGIADGHIKEIKDTSHGMVRTEIRCARCDGHLGHIFNDGPQPTGLRYCVNSAALEFSEESKEDSQPKPGED